MSKAPPGPDADALVLSPVFAPRKGNPALGIAALERAADATRTRGHALYALGGIDAASARRCAALGVGVAAIGAAFDADADELLETLELRDRAPGTPAALAAQNVPFAFYSDGLASPGEFLGNVRKAVKAGLSSDAALRALTLGAAQIYGVQDRLGSLEPGKIANLIVVQGDLLGDKTTIQQVFVDGRRFEVPADAGSNATSGAGRGPASRPSAGEQR